MRACAATSLVCLALCLAMAGLAPAAETPTAPAAGAPVTLRTWAVLVPAGLREAGLEDLILTDLATDPAITLVDRKNLDLVAKELALGTLLDAGGAEARRKAGALVKADALAILNQESLDGKPCVRLVVSETRSGARLRTEIVPLDPAVPTAAARAIAAAVRGVREHFAQGIQRVYGVPPFVSRSLSHEYDYLQRGYASLLSEALARQPGVAAIEVDEARQIAREIALTDGRDLQRLVPVFVEGEFQVPAGATGDAEVTIFVKLTAAGNDLPKVPDRKMRLSEAAAFLGTTLPALVQGQEKPGPAIDSKEQARLLAERAEVFAHLGSWYQSTALREASLLLVDDPAQRQALVLEYCNIVNGEFASGIWDRKQHEALMAECHRRAELWQAALVHTEYLVRNRQVTFQDGLHMADRDLYVLNAINNDRPNDIGPPMMPLINRFFREVFPLIRTLEDKPRYAAPGAKDAEWNRVVVDHLIFDYSGKGMDLDLLYEVIATIAPADVEPDSRVFYLISYPKGEATLAFIDKLEKSDRPALALAGRLGRLNSEAVNEKDPQKLQALAVKVQGLQNDYQQVSRTLRSTGYPSSMMANAIAESKRRLQWRLNPPTLPRSGIAVTGSAQPAKSALTLEPIDMEVRRLDKPAAPPAGMGGNPFEGPWPPVSHVVPCGDADAFWGSASIAVVRRKGVMQEILAEPGGQISSVQWDGRNLWVGSPRDGVRVLDLDGKVVAHVGAKEGLPSAERGIQICAAAPGKAVVAGALGEHERLWMALVELKGEKPTVKVFHEATRVLLTGEDWAEAPAAIDWVGAPHWMIPAPGEKKDAPVKVLLGWGWQDHAIQLDLGTLKVSLFNQRLYHAKDACGPGVSQIYRNGRIIESGPNLSVVEDGQDVYLMRSVECIRRDPATGKFAYSRDLSEGLHSATGYAEYFGNSALYGPIGWSSGGGFFRIVIAKPEKPPDPPPASGEAKQ